MLLKKTKQLNKATNRRANDLIRPAAYDSVIFTPIGYLGIQTHQNKLINIDILQEPSHFQSTANLLTKQIETQLQSYFTNPHYTFDIPIELQGTPFQCSVW